MTLAFFRRHRKWFMVLMFCALFSIVIFGWWQNVERQISIWMHRDALSVRVGSIAGEPVTERQLRDFRSKLLSVGDSIYLWRIQVGPSLSGREDVVRFMGLTEMGSAIVNLWKFPSRDHKPTHEDVLTWMALYSEAEKLGFSAPASAAEGRLKALQEMGLPPKLLMMGAQQFGLQQSEFVDGLSKDMTIKAYINWLAESMSAVVEPEMRRDFAKQDERVQVRLAALKADDALAEVKDIPEPELQAQFEKFSKFLPGASPEGYGYKIHDRVRIEYLVADPAAFEAEAQARVKDEHLRRYYDAYKDQEFVVKEEKPADEKAGAEGKGQPQPAEKKYQPFDKVKDEIRKKLVHEVAADMAKEWLHTVTIEIRQASGSPDLGMWADGQKIRLVQVPAFQSAKELEQMKGIGAASRGQDSLPVYAARVDALVGKDKAKLALKETSDVFTDAGGMAYAFRVTAVDPSHEPAALKDVRDKVVEDVRRMKAFEIVRERARALLKEAEAKGFEEAAKQAKVKTVDTDYVTRDVTYSIGGRPMTIPTSLPEVGVSRVLLDECFRMAEDKRKLILVTLTEKHMAVVVELVGEKAPRQPTYDLQRDQLADRVGRQLATTAFRKAIDPKEIRARMEVVIDERGKAAEGEAGPMPEPEQTGDE